MFPNQNARVSSQSGNAPANTPITSSPVIDSLSPETLREWLEWAGGKLLALPSPRLKPQKPRALWPDYAQDPYEVLYFRPKEGLSIRANAPTAEEIPFMDRILILPNLCPDERHRRVIHARSLVYPLSGRHLYPWHRIANILNVSTVTARAWHRKGLGTVCRNMTRKDHDAIAQFFKYQVRNR